MELNELQIFKDNFKKQKTLLIQFIRTTLDNYEEPERKGVPRGEQRGFPKKKMFVTLMALTTIPQKDIARITGVSFGQVRTWNAEKKFKDKVEDLCRRYAVHFVDSAIKIATDTLNKSKSEGLPQIDFSPVKDSFLYSPLLAKQISLEYDKRKKQLEDKGGVKSRDEQYIYFMAHGIVRTANINWREIFFDSNAELLFKDHIYTNIDVINEYIKHFQSLLLKKEFTKEDKEYLLKKGFPTLKKVLDSIEETVGMIGI